MRRYFRAILQFAVVAAGIVVIAPVVSCVSPVADPNRPFPDQQSEKPFLFFHLLPAYSPKPVSGIMVAVWPDGKIVRATSESATGREYVGARLSSDQMTALRREIAQSGILSDNGVGMLVLDAASETLLLRWGKTVKSWSHSPGFEGTGNSNCTNPRITAMKRYLMSLALDHALPEPAGAYADYPHAWYE